MQIEYIHLLKILYRRVILPPEVHPKLLHFGAPLAVRAWAAHLPSWCEVVVAKQQPSKHIADLDAREAAIQLALELRVTTVLIDELDGRCVAASLGLTPRGTLGILKAASVAGELDLKAAVQRLLNTNFSISDALVQQILESN